MSRDLKIIDFHSHILPCVDHGSDGLDTSESQVTLMNNAGVDTVVLTPHFYPNLNKVSTFTSEVTAAAEALASRCKERPRFCLGAEVLYCDGIEEMEDIDKLCIKGTNILMIELPVTDEWSRSMIYSLKRLSARHTVVLAHIDRYVGIHDRSLMSLLSEDNIIAQINSSSLFHGKMRRELKAYIESGHIYAIGSDLHGNDKRNYQRFVKARRMLGEESYSEIMTRAGELLSKAELY